MSAPVDTLSHFVFASSERDTISDIRRDVTGERRKRKERADEQKRHPESDSVECLNRDRRASAGISTQMDSSTYIIHVHSYSTDSSAIITSIMFIRINDRFFLISVAFAWASPFSSRQSLSTYKNIRRSGDHFKAESTVFLTEETSPSENLHETKWRRRRSFFANLARLRRVEDVVSHIRIYEDHKEKKRKKKRSTTFLLRSF